jgi:hypothetical protein
MGKAPFFWKIYISKMSSIIMQEDWNSFLCSRLTSLESQIIAARAIRLSVIAVAGVLIGVGTYVFRLPIPIPVFAVVVCVILGCIIWYLLFTWGFFKVNKVKKQYEELILSNINLEYSSDEIYQKYMKIKEYEKEWYMLLIRGRFLVILFHLWNKEKRSTWI